MGSLLSLLIPIDGKYKINMAGPWDHNFQTTSEHSCKKTKYNGCWTIIATGLFHYLVSVLVYTVLFLPCFSTRLHRTVPGIHMMNHYDFLWLYCHSSQNSCFCIQTDFQCKTKVINLKLHKQGQIPKQVNKIIKTEKVFANPCTLKEKHVHRTSGILLQSHLW